MAQPDQKALLDDLNVDLSDVVPDPLVEDGGQKEPVLFRRDRPVRNAVRSLPLHERDELHVPDAVLFEKAVDLQRVLHVDPVDDAEDVVLHPVLLQQPEAFHHFGVGGALLFVHAVEVVKLGGPVKADTDEKIVFPEKLAPLGREQGAVGLQRVGAPPAGGQVLPLQLDDFLKKLKSHQRRLPALPGERHHWSGLGLDVLLDVGFQQLLGHAETGLARVQALLFEVIAVLAVEIADGTDRFRHNMKRPVQTSLRGRTREPHVAAHRGHSPLLSD